VATSGNRSGEPLCIDPLEARQRLAGIADAFLVHDRPIARPLDDSVLQVIEGQPLLLRRARGYAPEPLALPAADPSLAQAGLTLLALSGDLKCAPALALGDRLWLAPHFGDLADRRCQERWQRGVVELAQRLGGVAPLTLICDPHPGYVSHQLACASGLPLCTVQHHLAHGLAVMAEHGLEPPLLVAALDGLGFGGPLTAVAAADGSRQAEAVFHPLWGGELLLIHREGAGGGSVEKSPAESSGDGPVVSHPSDEGAGVPWQAEHLAGLRPFPLPGGERAMAEPRRAALGLLLAAAALDHPGAWKVREAFAPPDLELLCQAVAAGCQAPLCSSAGRLFDGVASLLGLVHVLSYEGEGGLRLQGAAARALPWPDQGAWDSVVGDGSDDPLPLLSPGDFAGSWRLDWGPLLLRVLDGVAAGTPPELLAARFHRQLAEGLASALAAWADRLELAADGRRVALAGGCFQNRLLLEATAAGLRRRGLVPWWSQQVPANDGGLALGQVWAGRLGLAITLL
jgi:hydrogenase maturation protein HypF